jgi:hypothetical protein
MYVNAIAAGMARDRRATAGHFWKGWSHSKPAECWSEDWIEAHSWDGAVFFKLLRDCGLTELLGAVKAGVVVGFCVMQADNRRTKGEPTP